MKNILIVATFVPVLVAAATSSAMAQNREHLQMAAELRMLQEQNAQLALSVAQLAQALTDVTKALNARIDESQKASLKGFADQANTLRTIGDDLRAVRANTQETSTRLGELREEIEVLRSSVTSLLTRAPAVGVPTTPLDPNAPPQVAGAQELPPPPVTLPSTVGLSPERLFQTAFADYAAGQYSLAITGFEQFLKTFPTSERADDAQYYIGEAEVAQQRFEEAIAAYNAVIQNYPKGDQVPMAYYKRGVTQRRLGRLDEARASLELAIKTAPGSESSAAVLARQQLDGLTRTPPAAGTPQRP